MLLHRIDKYLLAKRTPLTRFGREVLGDSGFVLNYATVEARDR